GGILVDGEVRYGIEIPGLGSWLARGSVDREVIGFDQIPDEDEPPANVVHIAFQLMVGIGTGLALLGVVAAWLRRRWRRRDRDLTSSRRILWLVLLAGPASIVALEAGWTVTEVGRQPWIVHDVLRVRDAVTPNGGVWVSLGVIVVVYVGMATAATIVLRSMSRRWRQGEVDLPTPYGPPDHHTLEAGR
ncbi:MAG: cytochrome ubiquinol oxidase subunit I, partial [Actinobacteria bacterium]|nr:cytochrome ubiquinol oxidase subunit I [Actinomycetota bacterium]